jgi:hypothetical protein
MEATMALFDRDDDRSTGYRGDANRGRGFMDRVQDAFRGQDVRGGEYGPRDEHLRRDYENRSTRDGGYGRPMDREGGLHGRNSWSDGAWTADAAERTDREWNPGNRGRYDRDVSPFQAGWYGGAAGGMGMDRGGESMPGDVDDHGWHLAGGEWGHTGNLSGGGQRYDRGYPAGTNRGGGFLDRAQNAVRRGWDRVEERFDGDDRNGMHLGGGAMRGGTSWAGRYDRDVHPASSVRGYRDDQGHYGTTQVGGMRGSAGGMNRYGGDYGRGTMGRGTGYDRGYTAGPFRAGNRGREMNRYDNGYGRGRDGF